MTLAQLLNKSREDRIFVGQKNRYKNTAEIKSFLYLFSNVSQFWSSFSVNEAESLNENI